MLPAKAKYFTTYKNSYGIFGEKKRWWLYVLNGRGCKSD
jgi:hypothetical protein